MQTVFEKMDAPLSHLLRAGHGMTEEHVATAMLIAVTGMLACHSSFGVWRLAKASRLWRGATGEVQFGMATHSSKLLCKELRSMRKSCCADLETDTSSCVWRELLPCMVQDEMIQAHWMSPEDAMADKEPLGGETSMVWGLGITALELAERYPPGFDEHPIRVRRGSCRILMLWRLKRRAERALFALAR